jgi:AraC-like DNA-binding protein
MKIPSFSESTFDFNGWREAMARIHFPLVISSTTPEYFRAHSRQLTAGDVTFFDIRASAHIGKRTKETLQPTDIPIYGITVQLEGSSIISQDGVESVLTTGDFSIYDSTRPFFRQFDTEYRAMVMRFPQTMIRLPPQTIGRITARALPGNRGIGGVVAPFLLDIANNLHDLEGWSAVRVAHAAIDMVSTTLVDQLHSESTGRDNAETLSFLKVCDFIFDNLSDPGLSPDTIAAGNFISTRQLHKVFRAEGTTVSTFIREQRLEQCRRAFVDPSLSHLSVADIAMAGGIFDRAHFSRIFRTAYGMSPREYRRVHVDREFAH